MMIIFPELFHKNMLQPTSSSKQQCSVYRNYEFVWGVFCNTLLLLLLLLFLAFAFELARSHLRRSLEIRVAPFTVQAGETNERTKGE